MPNIKQFSVSEDSIVDQGIDTGQLMSQYFLLTLLMNR